MTEFYSLPDAITRLKQSAFSLKSAYVLEKAARVCGLYQHLRADICLAISAVAECRTARAGINTCAPISVLQSL
jgi:hypothetical protein